MSRVTYADHEILFTLERGERKTAAITVHPDRSVVVRVPQHVDDPAAEAFVRRRALWIIRQQRFFEQFEPRTPPREFVRGESHLYLGRKYRLRPIASEHAGVELAGGYLDVRVPDPGDRERLRAEVRAWYAARARAVFPERLRRCLRSPAGIGLAAPRLEIRWMRSRWGSLGPTGRLTLNAELIRAPRSCIDYVISHEICHLRQPDHSREFYALLERTMPDWEQRKLRLERLLS